MKRRDLAAAIAGAALVPQGAPAQPSKSQRLPLAVSTYSYWHLRGEKTPIEKVIEEAAVIGFDGVEILHRQMTDERPAYLAKLKRMAFERGLSLPMLSIHQDFVFPEQSERDKHIEHTVYCIEMAARMGIPGSAAVPKVAFVAPPRDFTALDGVAYPASAIDVVARVISMGNCHRAFALTAAMCLAVAARVPGSVVHEASRAAEGADVRLGHPSGVLPVAAVVTRRDGDLVADGVTVYRTARRLMEGFVRVP